MQGKKRISLVNSSYVQESRFLHIGIIALKEHDLIHLQFIHPENANKKSPPGLQILAKHSGLKNGDIIVLDIDLSFSSDT